MSVVVADEAHCPSCHNLRTSHVGEGEWVWGRSPVADMHTPCSPGDFELYQDNTEHLNQNNVGRGQFSIRDFFPLCWSARASHRGSLLFCYSTRAVRMEPVVQVSAVPQAGTALPASGWRSQGHPRSWASRGSKSPVPEPGREARSF